MYSPHTCINLIDEQILQKQCTVLKLIIRKLRYRLSNVSTKLFDLNLKSFCLSKSRPQGAILHNYYQTENDDESPFICSQPRENGMRLCNLVPTLYEEGLQCTLGSASYNTTDNTTCINWNQYYTNCSAGERNPFKDAINFDNIGYAWIAIFQVRCLLRLAFLF